MTSAVWSMVGVPGVVVVRDMVHTRVPPRGTGPWHSLSSFYRVFAENPEILHFSENPEMSDPVESCRTQWSHVGTVRAQWGHSKVIWGHSEVSWGHSCGVGCGVGCGVRFGELFGQFWQFWQIPALNTVKNVKTVTGREMVSTVVSTVVSIVVHKRVHFVSISGFISFQTPSNPRGSCNSWLFAKNHENHCFLMTFCKNG